MILKTLFFFYFFFLNYVHISSTSGAARAVVWDFPLMYSRGHFPLLKGTEIRKSSSCLFFFLFVLFIFLRNHIAILDES